MVIFDSLITKFNTVTEKHYKLYQDQYLLKKSIDENFGKEVDRLSKLKQVTCPGCETIFKGQHLKNYIESFKTHMGCKSLACPICGEVLTSVEDHVKVARLEAEIKKYASKGEKLERDIANHLTEMQADLMSVARKIKGGVAREVEDEVNASVWCEDGEVFIRYRSPILKNKVYLSGKGKQKHKLVKELADTLKNQFEGKVPHKLKILELDITPLRDDDGFITLRDDDRYRVDLTLHKCLS